MQIRVTDLFDLLCIFFRIRHISSNFFHFIALWNLRFNLQNRLFTLTKSTAKNASSKTMSMVMDKDPICIENFSYTEVYVLQWARVSNHSWRNFTEFIYSKFYFPGPRTWIFLLKNITAQPQIMDFSFEKNSGIFSIEKFLGNSYCAYWPNLYGTF